MRILLEGLYRGPLFLKVHLSKKLHKPRHHYASFKQHTLNSCSEDTTNHVQTSLTSTNIPYLIKGHYAFGRSQYEHCVARNITSLPSKVGITCRTCVLSRWSLVCEQSCYFADWGTSEEVSRSQIPKALL